MLAAAELFVLSSASEALPLSILEAMRAGLPIVASDEAVTQRVNGLLVPRGQVEPLRNALVELIAEPALRKRLGEASRAAYELHFRLEQMFDKTQTLYVRGLKAGSRQA